MLFGHSHGCIYEFGELNLLGLVSHCVSVVSSMLAIGASSNDISGDEWLT